MPRSRSTNYSRGSWISFSLLVVFSIANVAGNFPCPTETQTLSVSTTEEARDLAMALNCSGGATFHVQWEGTVNIDETITIMEGSILTVAGVGPGAIANGNGATQLFNICNASLYVSDLAFVNGSGIKGGALYVANASVTLGGDTRFEDNFSTVYGGGLWIGGKHSVVSWHGTTAFTGNSASVGGGAVAIEENATVSWSGDTLFHGNSAEVYGGAVFMSTAKLNWTGVTNFTENYSRVGAGALFSEEGSTIEWAGYTKFSNNSASYYGGATLMRLSNISWNGETIFRHNFITAALEDGGALQVEASTVSWLGKTSFIENEGSRGGALHLDDTSHVSWEGETLFCGNTADLEGGALYLSDYSTVSWGGGITTFHNNSARDFEYAAGGAISVMGYSTATFGGVTRISDNFAVTSGGALSVVESSIVFLNNSITVFEDNESGITGGAAVLESGTTLDLEAINISLSFTGNSAGIAGGAIYQFAISPGLYFSGVNFTSNTAPIGGAIYSLACGTETYATTEYVGCHFSGNWATGSGGAIESVAGKDVFLNTTFESNTAVGLGGALRLAGSSTITKCEFVGNGAYEAGPAVTNDGSITIVKASFIMNTLLCSSEAFLNYTIEGSDVTEDAQDVYYFNVCDGCEPCTNCSVDGNGYPECIAALDHTESAGLNAEGRSITLETLNINEGYWRAVANSTSILPCWNGDACRGGITGDTEYCEEGYTGPYCAVCKANYAAVQAYTCSKCSSADGLAVGITAIIVASGILASVIIHLSTPENTGRGRATGGITRTFFWKVVQAIPSQAFKTVVVSWQILTQFDSVADVTYPGAYGRFLDSLAGIISLDLGLVLSAGCAVKLDFHDRLLISTLGPLVALGALGICFKVATCRYHGSGEALKGIQRKHYVVALLITFLVYSSVSLTAFRMFACETLDDGNEYLRADYSILCTSGKHRALQRYAVFMIFIYPVGIPLLYSILLLENREFVRKARSRSELAVVDEEKVAADLWKPYKPEIFYFELVECFRRVALTGVVVFIYPNTAGQVVITLVMSFVFLVVSESLDPYASRQDTWASRVGHIVVFLSMFQALLIKVDVSDERSESQEVFGGVLLAANACMVGAIIVETVVSMRLCFRFVLPEAITEPRFRRSNEIGTRTVESWDTNERTNPSGHQ